MCLTWVLSCVEILFKCSCKIVEKSMNELLQAKRKACILFLVWLCETIHLLLCLTYLLLCLTHPPFVATNYHTSLNFRRFKFSHFWKFLFLFFLCSLIASRCAELEMTTDHWPFSKQFCRMAKQQYHATVFKSTDGQPKLTNFAYWSTRLKMLYPTPVWSNAHFYLCNSKWEWFNVWVPLNGYRGYLFYYVT